MFYYIYTCYIYKILEIKIKDAEIATFGLYKF
jgi:hypothetical protein